MLSLDWIMTEGHRTGFVEEMKELESAGIGQKSAEERPEAILGVYEMEALVAAFLAPVLIANDVAVDQLIPGAELFLVLPDRQGPWRPVLNPQTGLSRSEGNSAD